MKGYRYIMAMIIILLLAASAAAVMCPWDQDRSFLIWGGYITYHGNPGDKIPFNASTCKECLNIAEEAIASNSSDSQAWNRRGVILLMMGNYSEALEAFNKSIEIDPKDATAWKDKGVALYYLGRYNETIIANEKAINLS